MVVGVAVRQNHCSEIARIESENVEVVNRRIARQPGVIEEALTLAAAMNRDGERVSVLGTKLISLQGIPTQRWTRTELRRPSKNVDRVVHDDRDLGTINRLQPDPLSDRHRSPPKST
jgi:hypothetical protein